MAKKMKKETKESAEAKKKPAVKELDITNFPELIFDNDKGCIIAEFGDGRDSVMIELNGTQFAAAVLKINNEIYCCESNAQEKVLHEELEKKAMRMGANAIVGIDIDYETIGERGSMLMVSTSGTAVII